MTLVFDMAMSQLVGNAAETPETHMAKFRRNLYLHFLSVNRGKFGSENVTVGLGPPSIFLLLSVIK